jgi:hypothetical protein
MTDPGPKTRTIVETIEVAGSELLAKVREILAEGNVRRLRIRAGEELAIEMPLTVGAIMGGVVVLAAPWLAVLGVIAALVAKVQIEVERDADHDGKPEAPPAEPPADTPPGA